MSDIVQLYSDKTKTTKAYPKTLASETYMGNGGTVESEFDKVIANVTNGNESITNSEIVQARGEEINLNARLNKFDSQLEQKANKDDVARMSSATPMFANGIDEMVDKTRNYVNSVDGYVYIYQNGAFEKTSILYQSISLSENGVKNYNIDGSYANFIETTLNLETVNGKSIYVQAGTNIIMDSATENQSYCFLPLSVLTDKIKVYWENEKLNGCKVIFTNGNSIGSPVTDATNLYWNYGHLTNPSDGTLKFFEFNNNHFILNIGLIKETYPNLFNSISEKYLALSFKSTSGYYVSNLKDNRKTKLDWLELTKENFTNNLDLNTDKPEEYFIDEINDTINKIIDNSKKQNLIFNIVTDTHLDTRNIESVRRFDETICNIKEVNKNVFCDATICLGDCIISNDKTITQPIADEILGYYKNKLTTCNENTFMVLGNHDGLNGGTTNNEDWFKVARKYVDNKVKSEGNKPYFYIDYNNVKTRVIVLDVAKTGFGLGFDDEQLNWLYSEAFNTNDGWRLLFLTHINPITENGDNIQNKQHFINLVNAYHNHTDISFNELTFNGSKYKTTKTVAIICGHEHLDRVWKYSELPCKVITIAQNHYSGGWNSGWEGATNPSRKDKSVTQDLWDTMIYIPDDNIIKMIRFGAGNDRIIEID